MHYLDELLALYTGRDPFTQKYLLTRLSAVPIGFDAETLVDFLWRETGAQQVAIRHQARYELGKVLPAYLRHEYAITAGAKGVWTVFQDREELERILLAAADKGASQAATQTLLAAGTHLLSDAIEKALAHTEGGSDRTALAATLVAGRLGTRQIVEDFTKRLDADVATFAQATALSEIASSDAGEIVMRTVQQSGARRSDMIVLLGSMPSDRTRALLARLEPKVDAYGRANIAQALAADASPATRELLVGLIRRREGWVTAYALDALLTSPQPGDLALVKEAYALEPHEFIRAQAVRVAGYVPSPSAVEYLTERIKDGTPRVQAAALEALVRQDLEAGPLVPLAEGLLASPLLRARVNAILALARLDADRVTEPVNAMLFSDQAVHRLEGAFLLGYLRAPDVAASLMEVAMQDPSFSVKVQAVKSLARQPAKLALERLLAITGGADARVATTAARALAGIDDEAMGAATTGLVRQLGAVKNPAVRGGMLRTLGALCARRPGSEPPAVLADALSDPQAGVALAAIEGIKLLADTRFSPQLQRLANHPHARVRTRVALALFLAGEVDRTRPIEDALTESTGDSILAGMNALLELAVILPSTIGVPRFARLQKALEAHAGSAPCAEFARKAMPRSGMSEAPDPGRARPAPAARPDPGPPPPRMSVGAERQENRPAAGTNAPPLAAAAAAIAPPGAPPGAAAGPASPSTAPAAPVPVPGPAPIGTNTALRLKAFYAKRRRERPQDGRIRPEKVDEISYMSGLPVVKPPLMERLRAAGPLVLVPIGLMIPLLIVITQYKTPERNHSSIHTSAPKQAGVLKVVQADGQAYREPAGGSTVPLAGGDKVQGGDRVTTGSGASVQLAGKGNSTLWMGPSSRILLGNPASDATTPSITPFVFIDPSGDVRFDFRHCSVVEVILDRSRLVAHEAAFQIKDGQDGRSLSLTVGDATLADSSGTRRSIFSGDTVPLASALEPSPQGGGGGGAPAQDQ